MLRKLGIALMACRPLGRGFWRRGSGAWRIWRRGNPRFQGETYAKNLAIADGLRTLAAEKECTPGQLALGMAAPAAGECDTDSGDEPCGAPGGECPGGGDSIESRRIWSGLRVRLRRGAATGERYAEAGMKQLGR